MTKSKSFMMGLTGFIVGSILFSAAAYVFAHGGNTNNIHGCVGTGVLNQGRLRIIAANGSCQANETPLDWPKSPAPGTDFSLICGGCNLVGITGVNNKDFRNAFLGNSNLSSVDFTDSNFTDASFINANLAGTNFTGTTLVNADLNATALGGAIFTNADAQNITISGSGLAVNFSNANFTNATLDGVYRDAIATNSNFSSATLGHDLAGTNFSGSNFTNAVFGPGDGQLILEGINFTNANLGAASGLDEPNVHLAGVIWNNTTCPDGTNSNNNGNTCEGHLTP